MVTSRGQLVASFIAAGVSCSRVVFCGLVLWCAYGRAIALKKRRAAAFRVMRNASVRDDVIVVSPAYERRGLFMGGSFCSVDAVFSAGWAVIIRRRPLTAFAGAGRLSRRVRNLWTLKWRFSLRMRHYVFWRGIGVVVVVAWGCGRDDKSGGGALRRDSAWRGRYYSIRLLSAYQAGMNEGGRHAIRLFREGRDGSGLLAALSSGTKFGAALCLSLNYSIVGGGGDNNALTAACVNGVA